MDYPLFHGKLIAQHRSYKSNLWGNVKAHGLVDKAKCQDLKNILGTTTLIDCQSEASANEQPSERGHDVGRIVKHKGQWPIDLNGGSNTMFVYCELVHT